MDEIFSFFIVFRMYSMSNLRNNLLLSFYVYYIKVNEWCLI